MTLASALRGGVLEFLGVFFGVYAGGLVTTYSVVSVDKVYFSTWPGAVTQGVILGLFIYAGGGIAKIGLNPVATMLLVLTGAVKVIDGLIAIFFQMLGSVAAGAMVSWLFKLTDNFGRDIHYDISYPNYKAETITEWEITRFEAASTMILMVFILYATFSFKHTPTAKPILIGAAQFFGIVTNGQITGAAMNPARVFGPSLVDGKLFHGGYWTYYIGPLLGAAAALPLTWFLLLGRSHKDLFHFANKDDEVREVDQENEEEFELSK